jgi:hypothetical protein
MVSRGTLATAISSSILIPLIWSIGFFFARRRRVQVIAQDEEIASRYRSVPPDTEELTTNADAHEMTTRSNALQPPANSYYIQDLSTSLNRQAAIDETEDLSNFETLNGRRAETSWDPLGGSR